MSKIVLEDFNEGDGYYKVNLAYLSKEQVEEIEALISKWNPTDEVIKACIGMCLTDASEQRFKDFGTNLRDCLAWLEKQKEKEKYDRMMPVYDNLDSFESALAKAWKAYNDSGARTVDGCEDDYVECAHAKGFREGYLFGIEKQKPTPDWMPKFLDNVIEKNPDIEELPANTLNLLNEYIKAKTDDLKEK